MAHKTAKPAPAQEEEKSHQLADAIAASDSLADSTEKLLDAVAGPLGETLGLIREVAYQMVPVRKDRKTGRWAASKKEGLIARLGATGTELSERINALTVSLDTVIQILGTPKNQTTADSAAVVEALEDVKKRLDETPKSEDLEKILSRIFEFQMELAANNNNPDVNPDVTDVNPDVNPDVTDVNPDVTGVTTEEEDMNLDLKILKEFVKSSDEHKKVAAKALAIKPYKKGNKLKNGQYVEVNDELKSAQWWHKNGKIVAIGTGLIGVGVGAAGVAVAQRQGWIDVGVPVDDGNVINLKEKAKGRV